MESGKGLKCKIGNGEIICGNEKYFSEQNISISENIKKDIDLSREKATIIVFIAKNNNIIGSITLSDTIKSESEKTISELNKLNMETVLLSGDNENAVKNISDEVGIKKYHAGLLPED
ncbi:MAG: cation-translocating P-type ATPase, partial [Clostridia bacterium]|nr:cation-translocating P-type ATPase [Clostridia bacterium]